MPELNQLEDAKKAFVETVHCPRLIREDYLASLEKKDEGEMEDEVRPLLDDLEPLLGIWIVLQVEQNGALFLPVSNSVLCHVLLHISFCAISFVFLAPQVL